MDITKGIGIVLVILGHTNFPYRDFIYTFHMPLFYIVSGYLFNFSRWENNMQGFIKNKFFKLIVPYLCSCVFFYLIWLVIGHKFGEASVRNIQWFIPAIGILYGNGVNDYLIFNISLWFLPNLFFAEIVFLCLFEKFRKLNIQFFCTVVVAAIFGYIISKYMYLPGGLDIAFTAQIFLLIGNCIKKSMIVIDDFIITILLIIICGFCFNENGRVDMNGRVYQDIFLFYLGGVSGSLLCMILGKWIVKNHILNKMFSYCGKNSLIIMIFHMLGFKVLSTMFVFIIKIPLEVAHDKYWFLYSIFTLLFSLGIGYIIKECANISFKRFNEKKKVF